MYVIHDSMSSFKHLEQISHCLKAFLFSQILTIEALYAYPQN